MKVTVWSLTIDDEDSLTTVVRGTEEALGDWVIDNYGGQEVTRPYSDGEDLLRALQENGRDMSYYIEDHRIEVQP